MKNYGVNSGTTLSNFNFKVDCWHFAVALYFTVFVWVTVFLLLLLSLKEMLFRKGLGVSIHVVLHFASSGDVGDLYLV